MEGPTRIALGTAQLGLDYGIANRAGRPSDEEARALLEEASRRRLRYVDTAPSYGDAEVRIGRLSPRPPGFRAITKTPPDAAADVEAQLRRSAAALAPVEAALLLEHRPELWLGAGGRERWRALASLRDAGLVERIGISIYEATTLDALLDAYPAGAFDVVQLPLSALDQRLLATGHLDRLCERGVEVHARSVWLQGLLLLEPSALPPALAGARAALERFRSLAAERGRSPLAAALDFVLGLAQVSQLVCGAERQSQLREVLDAAKTPGAGAGFADCALEDPALVDPSRWPAGLRSAA